MSPECRASRRANPPQHFLLQFRHMRAEALPESIQFRIFFKIALDVAQDAGDIG